MAIFSVDPEPSGKVWLVRIKQTVHPILNVCRHVPELGVLDQVLNGVSSQWEALDAVAIDTVVQS
jgi:hypothetical protein